MDLIHTAEVTIVTTAEEVTTIVTAMIAIHTAEEVIIVTTVTRTAS